MLRNDSEMEHRYRVNIVERVRDLMLDEEIGEHDQIEYSWHHGYETLIHKRHGGGSSEYRGVYHPDEGYCVGRGICEYCGRTLHD